jgi:hypothetical protein
MINNIVNIRQIETEIDSLNVDQDEVVLFFIGEAAKIDIQELIELMNTKNIEYFGGIFPRVIRDETQSDSIVVIKKLKMAQKPILIHGLDNTNFEIPETLLGIDLNGLTAFTIVDGLTANIATFLDKLYDNLGNDINYIGGGAGSLTLVQEPCVFSKEGFFQDAAIVCLLKERSNLGVRHGWSKLAGPFVATQTHKNIIYQLNWVNAFEVYSETINDDASTQINTDNFFDIAKGYPFGIYREGNEDIVRDPIMVGENGELICVGEVPENTVLYILKGEQSALIESAAKAAEMAAKVEYFKSAVVIDCISRVLFLEDDFFKELRQVKVNLSKNDDVDIFGALTLGEISSYGDGVLEFFNKTIVVGVLS